VILLDTSVLVDYLKGRDTLKTRTLEMAIHQGVFYGISPYTYQELLQGAKNEREFRLLKDYLSTQHIYFLPPALETFEKAARLYFDLRRKGVTLRGTVDILIALTAMYHNLSLLHDDRDFDAIASAVKSLKIAATK
jgi:predicted nucleic acid-binding protein